MEDPGVRQLSEVFYRTVANDRDTIKQAEEQLKAVAQQPGYGITVLKVIALGDALGADIRLAAAVNFKNLIKYRWVPTEVAEEQGTQPIPAEEKAQIKSLLTGLMLNTPQIIRAQLSEALSLISDHDFPAQWPTLLPELVERLQQADLATINGVCHTANSIFSRYRNQYGSNEMVHELEASQNLFAAPALETLKKLTAEMPAQQGNPDTLKLLLSSVRLLFRIFFSLNSPGLTPLFESQLDDWMAQFHTYLAMEVPPSLVESDPEKEGVLDGVKAAVCANINLFMEMNEEEFAKYLQTFVTDVWHLLVKVSQKPGQDNLAMSAIRFLTTVARSVHHGLFKDPTVLRQICEAIVLPNLRVREEDEEGFEMNPVEYIRRDSEGSDSDTRRRAAADLVRALTEAFESQVTELFTGYVAQLLQEYAANPAANWKAKDCAVYLVLAVTVKGRTGEKGATTTNRLVQVDVFFQEQVLPELQAADVNAQPILKADALKFVTTFRSQLPPATALSLLPSFIRLLASEQYVVHSYAATAIERFLALKENRQHRLSVGQVSPYAQQMLEALFAAFKHPESSENEYLMKAVMRLISFLGPNMSPVAPLCLHALAEMLKEACKNPKSPGFNHYLFESVAALVRFGVPADPGNLAKFEDTLFPAFDVVLSGDVQEFQPYVFQVLAQLIELSPVPLRPSYMVIFPPLLTPLYWERPGSIPALTRLLTAYLTKAGQELVAGGHLPGLLGVFQKLVASKAQDQHGFALLGAVLDTLPPASYQGFLPTIWGLLFTRLQTSKTPKYTRGFTLFISQAICKLGPQLVASSMNQVQPNIFLMVLEQVWLPAMASVDGPSEDKLVAVAATKCLTECPEVFQARPLWEQLRAALDKKLSGGGEGAAAAALPGDEEDELPEMGYTAAYAKLTNAAAPERPVLAEIADPKQFAESSLAQFMSNMPAQ